MNRQVEGQRDEFSPSYSSSSNISPNIPPIPIVPSWHYYTPPLVTQPTVLKYSLHVFLHFFAYLSTLNSEGDQPWDFFGRNDAKAETPVLWPPHAKS